MSQDEIIEMARQAGIYHAQDSEYHWDGLTDQKIIERTPDSAKDIAWRNRRTFEILQPFAKLVAEKAFAQPEQEPVAWLLTDKNINSLQVDSIQRLIDRLKHAHHTDIRVRINGHDEWFEADWLKHLTRTTPPQPEQNPMSDEMLQAITDPENQPSQYGTVTLDYHFEKIKKWEDLFERMSNKVLQQPEQEPVAWRNAAIRVGEDLSSVGPDGYYDMTAQQWLDWAIEQEPRGKNSLAQPEQEPFGYFRYDLRLDAWVQNRAGITGTPFYTTPPQRKPLTDEEIEKLADDFLAYQIEDYQVSGVFTFARAIEAAHGIKENT